MKVCAACYQELTRENFSKKQWQTKQRRRCKDCIVANREVQLETPANNSDDAPLMSSADDEVASTSLLFKHHPPRQECPICMLPLPLSDGMVTYQECCGKNICSGCFYADAAENNIRDICPFCRTSAHTSEVELIERFKKRAELDDAEAIYRLGYYYRRGVYGLPRDQNKALKLGLRAGKLGCAAAYCYVGYAYDHGEGVEWDMKKGIYYYELAAMGGNVEARYNLGIWEARVGNMNRATRACRSKAQSWPFREDCRQYEDSGEALDDISGSWMGRIFEFYPKRLFEWSCNKR